VVIVKASESFGVGSTAQSKLALQELMQDRLRRSTERIANRLRQAGADTLQDIPDSPESSSSIRFRRLESYDPAYGPVWGTEETISLVAPDEDIGILMWNPGTGPRPWLTGVSEVQFSRNERRIHFALEASATAPDGEPIRVRSESNVTLQN
jgi:hypothetical protein